MQSGTESEMLREHRHLDSAAGKVMRGGLVVGALGLVGSGIYAAVVDGGRELFFQSYLVAYAYFLSIALGGLFFVLLHHATRSGWSTVLRRLAEGVSQNVMLMAVLFIPIVALGMEDIYKWAVPGASEGDELLHHKEPYLNTGFFAVRWVVYFAIWILYARYFFRRSVSQDTTGDKAATLGMQKHATHGVIAWALALTFAAFDMLMSLDPYWFSTIFGVYYFAGSTLAIFSTLVISAAALQRSGRIRESVTTEHYHDLGKLMFGFTVFWAYIAFSQYMLIWVADLPEETGWFLKRQTGPWMWISIGLLLGHFLVPFLILITRAAKRNRPPLVFMSCWILAMHYVDMFWLAKPEFAGMGEVSVSPLDFGLFLGIGGLFVAFTARQLRDCSLVPSKDPRLSESLALDNA